MSGQHDDDAGQQGIKHNVPRPEAEEKGGLERLHDLVGIHPVRQQSAVAAVVADDVAADIQLQGC